MKTMTIKDLKEKIKNLPDDTIVCCQSDSEGNETSVCLDVFIEKVGYVYKEDGYSWVGGENIEYLDTEKEKGKYVVILQPSL